MRLDRGVIEEGGEGRGGRGRRRRKGRGEGEEGDGGGGGEGERGEEVVPYFISICERCPPCSFQ